MPAALLGGLGVTKAGSEQAILDMLEEIKRRLAGN